MDLETVIKGEVSQKEKHKHHILTHTSFLFYTIIVMQTMSFCIVCPSTQIYNCCLMQISLNTDRGKRDMKKYLHYLLYLSI